MTTAKPKPMAGPTDSADDLIAELARLMAEDAQSDKPKADSPPVRIPGEPMARPTPAAPLATPAAPPPTQSAAAPKVAPETPGTPIRIPGQPFTPPAQQRPVQAQPQAQVPPQAQPQMPPRQDAPRVAPVIDPRLAHPDAPDPRSQPASAPEARHFAEQRTAPEVRTAPPMQSAPQVQTPPQPQVAAEPRPAPQAGIPPRREPGFEPMAPSAPAMRRESVDPRPEPAAVRAEPSSVRAEPAAVQAEPAPVRAEPVAPVVPPVEDDVLPDLDQDSLADLIAAELSAEDTAEAEPVETPAAAEDPFPLKSNDVFGVPPVFGVGSGQPMDKPAPRPEPEPVPEPVAEASFAETFVEPEPVNPQPRRAEPDPLEEIERLVGSAVRPDARQQSPSAALRSLATPTLPSQPTAQPASEKPRTPHVSSVDEAILAAAATSGARVEWVEPEIHARIADVDTEAAPRARKSRVLGMTRSLAGPLVATLMLGVAAVGLYAVLGLGGGASDGPAPLIVADTAPIKEEPVPDPEAEEPAQSVVFNEIAGVDSGADEQLVSRDQADIDAVNNFVPPTSSEEGLVNRKVRTVTVRPDGTIVSGGDSVAGATMLPVDRPSVPDVPGADFSTPELIGSVNPSATAAENAATEAAPVTPPVVPVQPGSTVPAVDGAGNAIVGKTAPVPLVRPATFARQAAATPTPAPAATTPVAATPATPAPAVSAPVSSAPAYVQLASQRSEETARQTAQSIASRFGPLFNGANLEVQRVDLGERGIFYRVRVPADSLQSANTLCNNIKAAGGDCFTM
ncbi:MAG: SPOR domain-containing protein [Devosia sp.]|uniref:SPOR domain-containing protein n=1 Tax=Devosia sp. TaxID=1871048 RepID=UPI001A109CB4|nr:SPOR domain-containing protein [Devosia sp.]MBF0678028.1 SPOR domain-containing protein [Devosia sp.]